MESPQEQLKKPAKGQFVCFYCKKHFLMRLGDWYPWNTMEVHLCVPCEKTTRTMPERNKSHR
jgi:hypothetical protein